MHCQNVVFDIHIFLTKLDNLEKVCPLSVGAHLYFAFVAKVGSLCAEEPPVTSFFKSNGKIIPQRRAARLDLWFNALHHSLVADAVFAPALSPVRKIEQHWHGAIDGVCKAGFWSVPVLELLPQGQKRRALRLGKYSKYPRD